MGKPYAARHSPKQGRHTAGAASARQEMHASLTQTHVCTHRRFGPQGQLQFSLKLTFNTENAPVIRLSSESGAGVGGDLGIGTTVDREGLALRALLGTTHRQYGRLSSCSFQAWVTTPASPAGRQGMRAKALRPSSLGTQGS